MAEKTPNHICRNLSCPNGTNGKPKHYWTCDGCDKINSWRSVACCPTCFQEYMQKIDMSRNTKVVQEKVITVTKNVDSDIQVKDTIKQDYKQTNTNDK